MPYVTNTQVKAMFRNIGATANPAVTDADIDEYIAEADQEIDGALTDLYALPIADANALLILRKISRLKVAGIVDDILNNYSEADKKPEYAKQGQALLNTIAPERDKKTGKRMQPTSLLPGATYLGTSRPDQGIRIKHNDPNERQFEKGVDKW